MYYAIKGGDVVLALYDFIKMSLGLNLFFLRIMKRALILSSGNSLYAER